MKRTFLDWNKPCIPALADCLLKKCRVGNSDFFDLSNYVLVFPNRAASKRFLTLLADRAWKTHCTIEPPRVKHMGDFMELLYEQKAPCASLLTQQILWTAALKQTSKELPDLFTLLYPNAPDFSDVESWFHIGAEMTETFQDLARENLDFSQVFQLCQARDSSSEQSFGPNMEVLLPQREIQRWELLARVEQIYYQRLDEIGLWDRQAARLFALRNSENVSGTPSKDFHISFRLGIVGCVDLSNLQREFLKRVDAQVEVFVFAPETMKERFEPDGCLKPGAWQRLEPELNNRLQKSLVQATSPEDQIQIVTDRLRSVAQDAFIEDVTLGLVDESLESLLLRSPALAEVVTPRSGKKVLADFQPWKLLKSMSDYYRSILALKPGQPLVETMDSVGPSYSALASFLRLEDVGNCLRAQKDDQGNPLLNDDWILELDRFFNQRYPSQMPTPSEMEALAKFPALSVAYRFVHELLQEMVREYSNFHSLLSIVTQFLKRVYCWKTNYDSQNEEEYQIIRGGIELNHAFSDKLQLPQALLSELPLAFPQALDLLLSQTADKQMTSSNPPGSISIQRWLDLPLDDAKVMFLIGMNEECVSVETPSEHILLPNQLRRKLNLKTSESRFERDVYNLSVIIAQRDEFFVSFGRISTNGRTLAPSRLLLTDPSDRLIDQVVQFFDDPKEEAPESSAPLNDPSDANDATNATNDVTRSQSASAPQSRLFSMPTIPDDAPSITEMSVTDFSNFISNPYIFYLQNVLGLKTVNDFSRELNAADFGNLLHHVMEEFGRREIARRKKSGDIDSSSLFNNPSAFKSETERIRKQLAEILNHRFFAQYGPHPLPIVSLQRSLLQNRLDALAEKQAKHYADGWQIWSVERRVQAILRENLGAGKPKYFGDDEGSVMRVHGILDRIDFKKNQDGSQEWRIWDYKTWTDSPNQKHFGRTKLPESLPPEIWRNLQLPLYLHLIRSAVAGGDKAYADLAPITESRSVDVGYILVPKKTESTKFSATEWDDNVLESANERIFLIANEVYRLKFPNLGELPLWDRGTEMEWILQKN